MNKYNPNSHHRRSIRLKGYDYSQAGLYFITICCQDRAHLFGENINGQIKLNAFGQIAHQEWMATEKIRNNIALHEIIVMPNHIHGIIEILFEKGASKNKEKEIGKFRSPSQTIGAIIRGYKIATIKKIKDRINNYTGELDSRNKEREDSSTGELQFAPTQTQTQFASTQTQFDPTTKKIIQLNFKIWQRNYYEHIIRNELAYQRISEYIINNPKKWEEDKFHKK